MIAMEQIEALSREIAEQFQPRQIILFGSYAYGEPTEESDVDPTAMYQICCEVRQTMRQSLGLEEDKPDII